MSTVARAQRRDGPLRTLFSVRTWMATIHLLIDLWVGICTFTIAVVGLALSVGLLPAFLLGLPVFAITAAISHQLARFERGRYALTLDVRIPDPRPPRRRAAPPGSQPGSDGAGGPADPATAPEPTWFRRQLADLAAGYTWRELGYHVLLLPLGALNLVLTLAVCTLPAAALTLPIYNWALPNGGANLGFGLTIRTVPTLIAVFLLGAADLLFMGYLLRGLAAMDAAIARALLGPSQGELAARVGELERSRARVVDAAEAERRRIERDLHDGAQQRLVALAMNLGRAKARYASDPDTARALLDEAHDEAKLALVELRNLARGIHPAVLTDRGLDAALSGLASRSPVPVTVEVDPSLERGGRPSQTVEAIAYFVVAEALTNIAKHSRAHRASVVVRRLNGALRIVIADDGVGGADPAGSGLVGLADRVSGVDGHLQVVSPAGGPTVLTVELPCAS